MQAPLTFRHAAHGGDSARNTALVVRQPIHAPALKVAAYELLYGQAPGTDTRHGAGDDSEATLRMLADAALEIGLDRLAGGLPVYINYPPALLAVEKPLSLQPQRVVIQFDARNAADDAVKAGLSTLKQRGHLVALAGYSPQLRDAQLLDLADIVKIPQGVVEPTALERLVPALNQRGLRVIATDLATIGQFEQAALAGCDGFQGTFLSQPQQLQGSRPPRNGLATLRLLATLQSPGCTFEEVEALMGQDLAMSYRALRCVNSSFFNLPRRVDSIRQALVLLGMDHLRQLCSLAALQQLEDRPNSVLVMAMARARMCEQLARLSGQTQTAPYFITGLFSMLDILMDMPIEKIVKELPLTPAVEAALVSDAGDLGQALSCARAYEGAIFHEAVYGTVSPQLIRAAYIDAVYGAEQALAA